MPKQTITIKRHGSFTNEIDGADVLGDFAIHENITAWSDHQGPLWTVTHIPTGWACLHTRTKRAALAARREFVGCGLSWEFTDPKAMTWIHRTTGAEIKRRWERR